jgi:hypothetical protein
MYILSHLRSMYVLIYMYVQICPYMCSSSFILKVCTHTNMHVRPNMYIYVLSVNSYPAGAPRIYIKWYSRTCQHHPYILCLPTTQTIGFYPNPLGKLTVPDVSHFLSPHTRRSRYLRARDWVHGAYTQVGGHIVLWPCVAAHPTDAVGSNVCFYDT